MLFEPQCMEDALADSELLVESQKKKKNYSTSRLARRTPTQVMDMWGGPPAHVVHLPLRRRRQLHQQ